MPAPGGSSAEEYDVVLHVAASGGEQLQIFGHHLIAEPEADRQHMANPRWRMPLRSDGLVSSPQYAGENPVFGNLQCVVSGVSHPSP